MTLEQAQAAYLTARDLDNAAPSLTHNIARKAAFAVYHSLLKASMKAEAAAKKQAIADVAEADRAAARARIQAFHEMYRQS